MYTMTYLMYKYERRLITAAERRAADMRAGQAAAALRDLRLSLGRAFRLGHRVQHAPGVAAACAVSDAAAPAPAPSSCR